MSPNTKHAILRRWAAGYTLRGISREIGCSEHEAAKVLLWGGVGLLTIESRGRRYQRRKAAESR